MFLKLNTLYRLQLPFRKEKKLCVALYNVLGFYPRRLRYYQQALKHRSSTLTPNPSPSPSVPHNERLEFLGDAVLEAITSDLLFRHFKTQREGFLTTTRSKIVKRETLNKLAQETGLVNLIHANEKTDVVSTNVCGNAFEALIGAIYLDRGYDACRFFMQKRILRQILDIDSVAAQEVNFKSKLLEWGQKRRYTIEFCITDERSSHTSHPWFETCVVINGIECERRRGSTKRESHQRAARATLIKIHHDHDYAQRFRNPRVAADVDVNVIAIANANANADAKSLNHKP